MLKPLIKYTGGKYKEYDNFKIFIPETINNYYEPFFGGGGVFFRLYNDKKIDGTSYINDFSDTLMEFYESVSATTFKNDLTELSDAWESVKAFAESFYNKYGDKFNTLMLFDKTDTFITQEVKDFIKEGVSHINYNTHGFSLEDKIIKGLKDKLSRFRKKRIGEEETDVAYKCITTCICQAFYFIVRDMYNDWNNHNNKGNYTKNERSAQWAFIREFCFGSMFRFGPNGDFNIPYGGFGYNSKCFSCKIENIIDKETVNLFKKTKISCGDFETAINSYDFSKDDFMFLDPPYDSTFTDYDGNGFTKEDHKRLEQCLRNCKCKWLMVIGRTDFIYNLYKKYNIVEYDKTYMYQARGDYDNKHTTHLVITNYPIKVGSLVINDYNVEW